jgi:hypothetical protein
MTVTSAALLTYERLRTEVLNGNIRPEGFAAIAYHGMVRGLTVILAEPAANTPSPPSPGSHSNGVSLDRDLLRLIANMVLQSQSQVMHVY